MLSSPLVRQIQPSMQTTDDQFFAAGIRLERWNSLLPEQQQKFAPICLNFVVELKLLQEKMEEYIREPRVQLSS